MIVSQKDIFVSTFREFSDDDLFLFIRLLDIATSVLEKTPVEKTKAIIDELLDDEVLYDEDLLTKEEAEKLSEVYRGAEFINALIRQE